MSFDALLQSAARHICDVIWMAGSTAHMQPYARLTAEHFMAPASPSFRPLADHSVSL